MNMESLPSEHTELSLRWNLEAQTPHGGQEWRDITNFVEDFSVTTNALGTPKKALQACLQASSSIHHYPPSDHDPAWSSLARFLLGDEDFILKRQAMENPEFMEMKQRLLLGNGASEMIDLCVRLSPGKTWKSGPFQTQYKEYQRSATNNGKIAAGSESADLVCIVNPCNPTGDFLEVDDLKTFIEKSTDGSTVIVDESMIVWHGPKWRQQSLVSQTSWVKGLLERRQISVFVIHSWTKIWSCPGLRLGSVLAPSAFVAQTLRRNQIPWSLNCFAIEFLNEVVHDIEYLQKTWEETPKWRSQIKEAILSVFPSWTFHGVNWQSFLWIDTHSEDVASRCVRECKLNGVPIRWGRHGYELPSFIRIAVRESESVPLLIESLRKAKESLKTY